MRLRQPTDFLILKALEEGGRNVAPNLAEHTGKSRKNINTRLPILADYGLVTKIGPAERSGLYEITSKGKAALIYEEEYDTVADFETLIEEPDASEGDATAPNTGVVRGQEDDSTQK